ncbi:MAG: GNAT family N-acetyltransferase [Burkholderiaceae bacterium]|nr:MAG: GNAT family N-acetyltransferase [Burkholderiaceae bacterium]TAM05690.1 MAG: GNAT family N-acetyltransferase [Pusillimonas sp.]
MEGFSVRLAIWSEVGAQASAIREEVFVREQKVPPEEELDEEDVFSIHVIACDAAGTPIGTGRLLRNAHIGRMAVRRTWRGKGVGSAMLLALVDEARLQGFTRVVLSAQYHARGFYAAHGFVAEGEIYKDAGIEHVTMTRALRGAELQ